MTPIRIVIVGTGLRAIFGIRAVLASSEFQLVGLVEPLTTRLEVMKQEFNLQAIPSFADLRQCLRKVNCDAVAVFTPDGTHAEVVLPALQAGKHVFVEKPLEITQEHLQAIIAADARAGGRTFVGFNLRYAPAYTTVRRLLEQGVTGPILTIQADEFYDAGRTYFRRWNRLRQVGGGLWITKACHDFDLLYWLAGAEPTTVYARSGLRYYVPKPEAALYCRDCQFEPSCPDRYAKNRQPGDLRTRLAEAAERGIGQRPDLCLFNSDKDTFDHGMATVSFANGVIATYTVNVVAGFSNRRLRISGTKATIDAQLNDSEVVVWRRDPSAIERVPVTAGADGHGGADASVFPAFADFVRGRPCRHVAPAEAAWAVRMGLAARQSCDQGCAISIEPTHTQNSLERT